MKREKLYFLDTSSERCYPLDYFDLEKLEEVNFEVYEAIPDNNIKDFIFCSLDGEVGDREFCKKSECKDYTSTSGIGVCSYREKLFKKGKKVNVKNLIK